MLSLISLTYEHSVAHVSILRFGPVHFRSLFQHLFFTDQPSTGDRIDEGSELFLALSLANWSLFLAFLI